MGAIPNPAGEAVACGRRLVSNAGGFSRELRHSKPDSIPVPAHFCVGRELARVRPSVGRCIVAARSRQVRPAARWAAQATSSAEEAAARSADGPEPPEGGSASYDALRRHLEAGEWEQADDETRRLLCALAGEGAAKRKWIYFSEVQFIPEPDLLAIDAMWREHSGGRFGFSVQRRMWNMRNRQWKPLFLDIGWTFGPNSTYKKFPADFTWDLSAPAGHLPLTNALRGTQLMEKLLLHPAFAKFDEEESLDFDAAPPSFGAAASGAPAAAQQPPKKEGSVLEGIFNSADYGF